MLSVVAWGRTRGVCEPEFCRNGGMRGEAGAVEETLLAYGESISRPFPLSFTARNAVAREVGCDEVDAGGCGRRPSRKRWGEPCGGVKCDPSIEMGVKAPSLGPGGLTSEGSGWTAIVGEGCLCEGAGFCVVVVVVVVYVLSVEGAEVGGSCVEVESGVGAAAERWLDIAALAREDCFACSRARSV